MDNLPSYESIRAAMEIVSSRLPPTPAWSYPLLDREAGVRVVVKHENTQPTGAFKIRGGVNLAATLPQDERARGVITASTGNHAQSVAYAGHIAAMRAVVVLPAGTSESIIAAVKAWGAEVIAYGDSMTDALGRAQEIAEQDGLFYVDPGNNPSIVSGHGTVFLELLDQHPDLETIYVPVGSGTGAASACLVRDAVAPRCRIVGVQSQEAPAAYESWKHGSIVSAPSSTRHRGLATGQGFMLTQSILRERLDDFLLVSDDAITHAAQLMATHAHTLAEGAGAAALAGLLADPRRTGITAVICTGGNAGANELSDL